MTEKYRDYKNYLLTLQKKLAYRRKVCKARINKTHQGYASFGKYPQIGGFFLFVGAN